MITPKKRARKKISTYDLIKIQEEQELDRAEGIWEMVTAHSGNRFVTIVNQLYDPRLQRKYRRVKKIELKHPTLMELTTKKGKKIQIQCWDRSSDEDTCWKAKNKYTITIDNKVVGSWYSQNKTINELEKLNVL